LLTWNKTGFDHLWSLLSQEKVYKLLK
jgi:hypothetical protein